MRLILAIGLLLLAVGAAGATDAPPVATPRAVEGAGVAGTPPSEAKKAAPVCGGKDGAPVTETEPPAPPLGSGDAPVSMEPKPAGKAPAFSAPAKPAAATPALDLASLEKRLKDTSAIGLFTKLTLKNQLDDLLDRFRDFHQGRIRTTAAELRQPYDLLILKVLTLLQDADPLLARVIGDSREAIWGILSDSAKFSRFQS